MAAQEQMAVKGAAAVAVAAAPQHAIGLQACLKQHWRDESLRVHSFAS